MLNAYFRVQGYDVFTVNWGEDGVRSGQSVHPDLVILDIRLPDIDGYEVARRLRADRHTADIPIIFLTEKRDRADRLQGLELGADDFILIMPPGNMTGLSDKLRSRLEQSMEYFYPVKDREQASLKSNRLDAKLAELSVGHGQYSEVDKIKEELFRLRK